MLQLPHPQYQEFTIPSLVHNSSLPKGSLADLSLGSLNYCKAMQDIFHQRMKIHGVWRVQGPELRCRCLRKFDNTVHALMNGTGSWLHTILPYFARSHS